MYELLKSYEGIGKRVFEIEELKQILGVEDKYDKFANFKKRILLKAQEDLILHTDISFTFEEISENSRRVEKIAFYIHKNSPKQKLKHKTSNDDFQTVEEANLENPLDTIRGFGVMQLVIDSEILPNFDEFYISETLKNCQLHFKTNKVTNKAGFFISALQKGYYKSKLEQEQLNQDKKDQTKQQELFQMQNDEKQKTLQEEQLQKLREQYMDNDFIELVLEQYQ